mmetsp:Transcript_34871/g.87734  ORF Transcript_34871/g.87734 Transcript_34871/m.87734 type:complete len:239 (-) Transcript_34871:1579-2295(-)
MLGEVAHLAVAAGVCKQGAAQLGVWKVERVGVAYVHLVLWERLGARQHDSDGLRRAVLVDEELGGAVGGEVEAHGVCFCSSSCLVQQGGIRHAHAREVGHHGLVVQQHLQPPLRDLGLVGRVRGVPRGVLHNVAQDDTGRDGVVVAKADVGLEHLVLLSHLRQDLQCPPLTHIVAVLEVQWARQLRVGGQQRRDELLHGFVPDRVQHLLPLLAARADVAGGELVEGSVEITLAAGRRS